MEKISKKEIRDIEDAFDVDFSRVDESVVRGWIRDGIYDNNQEKLVHFHGSNLAPEGLWDFN